MVLDLLNMNDEYIDALDIDVMVVDECDQIKVVVEVSPVFSRMCLKNVNWKEILAPVSENPHPQYVTFEIR